MTKNRGPPLATSRASVPLRRDGSLTLGLVAETHSSPDPRGLEHLAALKPDVIIHGGDIGDLSVLDTFGCIAPVHAVRGNIDVRAFDLPDGLVLSFMHEGRTQLTASEPVNVNETPGCRVETVVVIPFGSAGLLIQTSVGRGRGRTHRGRSALDVRGVRLQGPELHDARGRDRVAHRTA